MNTGIENLDCISEYDRNNPKDEAHSWIAVHISNAADVWVRNTVFRHFAGSAVFVREIAKRITVENCKYLEPVTGRITTIISNRLSANHRKRSLSPEPPNIEFSKWIRKATEFIYFVK
ncbi:MAG: hypothetical protein LBH19_12835 [Dysgonamonadaceae bacterium]|jgi:hypothetical protein|nr:hypothetical protein [Dysgonamonadaceae bacterium]